MKIIASRVHGYFDYATVIVFLVAPTLFGLSGIAAILSYTLAAIHLAMTLFTDFALGIGTKIPFVIHGGLERVVGPLLIIVPFILGLSAESAARNFYILVGVAITLVAWLTNYREIEGNQAQAYREG